MTQPEMLSYNSQPRVSGMAKASMILGIVAIPTSCFGVGILLGVLALVFGIVSRSAINKNPELLGGKGFAKTGIITGALSVMVLPLLLVVLWPWPRGGRELANRTACAAYINGTLKAMLVFANDHGDVLPVPPAGSSFPTYAPLSFDPRTAAGNDNSLSPFGILIAEGSISPRNLLCKSDPHVSGISGTSTPGGIVSLFTNQNSYSIAVPWSAPGSKEPIGEWWKARIDSSLPLMGDMVLSGPGIGRNAAGLCSVNHQGDGQNVGYADAHVEWTRNVTTINPAGKSIAQPLAPIAEKVPYDVMMTPHKTTGGVISP